MGRSAPWSPPGYLADVIAMPGDPLQGIGVLQGVALVMNGGVVYKK
jgi:imidazolonepropionase-like amidohydrolase